MKIKILSSAMEDLSSGYRFYEKQARGVGQYFLDTLFSEIDSLLISAGTQVKCFHYYHRLLSRRFPFAVYYKLEGDEPF